MNPTDIAHLIERVRCGRPTIVLGTLPPLPKAVTVVRVRCDLPGTLGPLDRALDRIERLLDGDWRDASNGAARKRMLGADAVRSREERFTTACNRLAARAPGSVALVLDGVDCADEATHKTLARILGESGRLHLPLILVVRDTPRGSFLDVVDAIAQVSRGAGDGAGALTGQSRAAPTTTGPSREVRMDGMDRQALRVLRAGSLIGSAFEAPMVASLLDLTIEEVLEALQRVRDAGVPIEDDESGHFEIPQALQAVVVASILPSLRKHWHELLGELFSEAAMRDPLRSAAHLDDAGERERSLGRRLEAVAMLVRAGDVERAAGQLAASLEEISALPRGSRTAGLSARAKLERARLRWLGAGLEPSFTLAGALDAAFEARAELGEVAPAAVRADIASTIAGIAYDLGDGASLERAEKVLSETVASLSEQGAAVEAATLLNDQAAIQLRMGKVIRVLDLLGRSCDLLTAHVKAAPGDAAARLDLAETYHLLARLPLHRGGDALPADAVSGALAHAQAAEVTYRALGLRRDLGRVTETKARLEAKRGNADAARAAFTAAMQLADEVADITGLARTTAGLAELLSAAGAQREALNMLASSIELNRKQGSPVGLAFDERILDEVDRTVAAMPRPDPTLRDELARTRARLVAAMKETS